MSSIPYTITNESITVVSGGKVTTVQRGATNFQGLRDALVGEDWASVPKYLTVVNALETWAKGLFKVVGNAFYYNGRPLPSDLNSRIIETANADKDPTSLLKFWERLQNNPSMRSVNQAFAFLKHQGIPIDSDGFVLAYKSVRADYMDHHSGTCLNTIGTILEMPRNQISDDPDVACHFGYHVGALAYAQSFGGAGSRILICRVDPADIVSVPKDCSAQKMRVCKYEVIGHYGSQMASTVMTTEEINSEDEDVSPTNEESTPANGDAVTGPTASELNDMDEVDLAKVDLKTLRSYAAKELKIIGASKIPGGKPALIDRIVEVRR